MKQVLLDYLDRKGWLLFLQVLLSVPVSILFACSPTADSRLLLAVVQIAFFCGVAQLSAELKQGAARVTATLPLSSREIGRAWWVASAGIPGLVATLAFVPGLLVALSSGHPDWRPLSQQLLGAWLLLGSSFVAAFGIDARSRGDGLPARLWRMIAHLFWGAIPAACILFPGLLAATPAGYRAALMPVLFGGGCVLTAFGWWRAGDLVAAHAAAGRASASPVKTRGREAVSIRGNGGLLYLLGRACVPPCLFAIGVVIAVPALSAFRGGDWRRSIDDLVPVSPLVLLFAMMIGARAIPQFRLLRSLPVSAAKLGWTFVAVFAIPAALLACLLFFHRFHAGAGIRAVLPAAQPLLAAGLICLLIALTLWDGFQTRTVLFIIVYVPPAITLWIERQLAVSRAETSVAVSPTLALLAFVFAFLLARRGFMHGDDLYRNADRQLARSD